MGSEGSHENDANEGEPSHTLTSFAGDLRKVRSGPSMQVLVDT